MKAKHGWVLETAKNDPNFSGFYQGLSSHHYDGPLTSAQVYNTRYHARDVACNEVVRKVSLDAKGNAVKVMPGR